MAGEIVRFIQLTRRHTHENLAPEVMLNVTYIVVVRKHLDGNCTIELLNDDFVEPTESYDVVVALLNEEIAP